MLLLLLITLVEGQRVSITPLSFVFMNRVTWWYLVAAICLCFGLFIQAKGNKHKPVRPIDSLLLLYLLMSSLWSLDPANSFKSAVGWFLTFLLGYAMATNVDVSSVMRIFVYAYEITWIFVIIVRFFGNGSAAWNYKNLIGLNSLTCVLILLLCPIFKYRLIKVAHLTICMSTLFISNSKTAWILLAVIVLIIRIPYSIHTQKRTLISHNKALILLIMTILVTLNVSTFLNIIGKDLTITGRAYIWEKFLEVWRYSPIIGNGLDGYSGYLEKEFGYLGQANSRSWSLGEFVEVTGGAHSTYISVLTDLGIIGLLIFMGFVFSNLRLSKGMSRRNSQNPTTRVTKCTFGISEVLLCEVLIFVTMLQLLLEGTVEQFTWYAKSGNLFLLFFLIYRKQYLLIYLKDPKA